MKKSKRFNTFDDIKPLAKGGEAEVFNIEMKGVEEVVVKVPIKVLLWLVYRLTNKHRNQISLGLLTRPTACSPSRTRT